MCIFFQFIFQLILFIKDFPLLIWKVTYWSWSKINLNLVLNCLLLSFDPLLISVPSPSIYLSSHWRTFYHLTEQVLFSVLFCVWIQEVKLYLVRGSYKKAVYNNSVTELLRESPSCKGDNRRRDYKKFKAPRKTHKHQSVTLLLNN